MHTFARRLRAALAAAALLPAACRDAPAGPPDPGPVEAAPLVDELAAHYFLFHRAGALSVTAVGPLPDAPPEGGRITLTARTDAGDHETLFVEPVDQAKERRLVVIVRKGMHVARLADRLDGVEARLADVIAWGYEGTLHVFGPDPASVLEELQRWDDVSQARVSEPFLGVAPGRALYEGSVRLDEGEPTPGNGRLEVRLGDVVTVEYRPQRGPAVTATVAVRVPSEPDVAAFLAVVAPAVEAMLYGGAAPPPLLVDAASFAREAFRASGRWPDTGEVMAKLPPDARVVSPAEEAPACSIDAMPRDCSPLHDGTFLQAQGVQRAPGAYDVVVNFRAPADPAGCLRQAEFVLGWTPGGWVIERQQVSVGC